MELRKETNLYNDDAIQNGMDTVATQKAQQAVSALDQQAIFNKLTNNGSAQGIFLENGQLYINMSYLQTGTLRVGGLNNVNGTVRLYNSSNQESISLTNTGFRSNAYRNGVLDSYITIYNNVIDAYLYYEDENRYKQVSQIYMGNRATYYPYSELEWLELKSLLGGLRLMSSSTSLYSPDGWISLYADGQNGKIECSAVNGRFEIVAKTIELFSTNDRASINNYPIVVSDKASNSSSENSRIKLIFHYPPNPESIGFLRYDGTLRYVTVNSSDEKLKWNIKPSTVEALDILDAIKYYSFDYKNGGHHEIGYIAQELEKHIPTAVFDVPQFDEKGAKTDTIKQLNDHEIIVYATKAIQELHRKVIELETRINNM